MDKVCYIVPYFKHLTVTLYIFCALNKYVKFCANRILFTI